MKKKFILIFTQKGLGQYDETFQPHRPGLRQLRGQNGFMTQKMTIQADPERFEEIMDQVVKVCRKVEPDCQIVR